jgi:hypothetical protein
MGAAAATADPDQHAVLPVIYRLLPTRTTNLVGLSHLPRRALSCRSCRLFMPPDMPQCGIEAN